MIKMSNNLSVREINRAARNGSKVYLDGDALGVSFNPRVLQAREVARGEYEVRVVSSPDTWFKVKAWQLFEAK